MRSNEKQNVNNATNDKAGHSLLPSSLMCTDPSMYREMYMYMY